MARQEMGDDVKLKAGEARQLAELLVAVARPRTPAEQAEVEKWLKRLHNQR